MTIEIWIICMSFEFLNNLYQSNLLFSKDIKIILSAVRYIRGELYYINELAKLMNWVNISVRCQTGDHNNKNMIQNIKPKMKHEKKQTRQLTEAVILKKIQKAGVNSSQEYEMIISNLQQQNMRLMNDREELKIRVDILVEKQNQLIEEQTSKVKKNPTTDYNNLKKKLEDKYKEFQAWQKKCYNSINRGALNLQLKDYLNQCSVVEAEIARYRKILYDEKKQHKKLQKSVKIQLKHLNKNVPQTEVIEEENKELRRMIWNMRVVEDLTGHVEVRLHNSIVSLQSRKKFIDRLKTMTVEEIRREDAKTKIEIINAELKEKKQKHQSLRRLKTQSRLSKHKSSFELEDKKIEEKQMSVKNKEAEKTQTEQSLRLLQAQRNKLREQENRLKQVLSKQEAKIAEKLVKTEIEMVEVCLQVSSFIDENPLPRQIVGNQTELLQDDRIILKASKDTFITGLVAYQNKIGMACLRALYSNGKQTSCVPPEQYLSKKCQSKKIILHDTKDYLKWIKIYYDTRQKKVVRLQIYSNNKLKFEIGKEKDLLLNSVMAYKFDNAANQIPVCLRVSYSIVDQHWVLSSMGVQINCK